MKIQSRKARALVFGVPVVLLAGFLKIEIEYAKLAAQMIGAYMLGQGMADFGKEKK